MNDLSGALVDDIVYTIVQLTGIRRQLKIRINSLLLSCSKKPCKQGFLFHREYAFRHLEPTAIHEKTVINSIFNLIPKI